MNKLARISATVASSLALVAGFSGIAGATSIDGSGRNSENEVKSVNVVKTHVDNDTDVSVHNWNNQEAESGDANVHGNDDVDGVSTGNAWNNNSTEGNFTVHNTTSAPSGGGSGSGGFDVSDASISDSGRGSENEIKSINVQKTSVSNDTDVHISNSNHQEAESGDANVHGNDDVGNVSTGDASNTNSSSFSVSVSNTTN